MEHLIEPGVIAGVDSVKRKKWETKCYYSDKDLN